MTNTPHGQVPDTLIDLIDAYAETRHRCGGIHNARTEAARKAVIEALSEVQALSAAPAVPTSVKGAMWFTKKPVTIQAIQWTGENLREVITFTDGSPRFRHAGMAWDAYRDLVARDGLKIYTLEGTMLASPGDWIIRGVKGEMYPCKDEIFQETYAAASPTPPAEQQAAPKAAPQQEVQEPALFVSAKQLADLVDPSHATGGSYLPARKTRAGLFTQPLYTAPHPPPAPLSEMPYEKRKAIQEGAQISASDAWFHARHEMLDTIDRRNIFRAGFDRGWDAALAAQGDTP